MLFAALVLLMQTATPAPPIPEACAYEREAMLALEPDAFDQDMNSGWRAIAARDGCETVAADLLAAYRAARWGTLDPGALHINYWHEGQLRADAGQSEAAIPLLLAGVNPTGSTSGFADYALGTVAFLNRDRAGLAAARARLAAVPEPADWAETQAEFRARYGSALAWPPNLNVLDGLTACFDKPYKAAYSPPCVQPIAVITVSDE